jgi:hypothetical protein
MASRLYTIVVSDGTSGAVRRFTIPVKPVVVTACVVVTLPVLIGVGAAWKAKADVSSVYATKQALEVENASYREATEELATQIESLQSAIQDLGARSALDPAVSRAMQKLPALVKARAMGGGTVGSDRSQEYAKTLSTLTSPEDTFGMLRNLLEGLESRLSMVRTVVDKRNALAAATPSIWPARGWLTSTMGVRQDPITGDADFHPGLDIAGDKGQPVHATAAGTVRNAGWENGYGNVITIDHGFGLQTRYGPPAEVRRQARRQGETRRRHRPRGQHRAVPPDITCITKCWPTAGSSTRFSFSPSRNRAISSRVVPPS